ncbi:amidohydrolase family protein [Candidatus Bipolaricaulota bacterium]
MRRPAFIAIAVAMLSVMLIATWGSGEEVVLVLIHGYLIDGTGADPIEDAVVVIRDGVIVTAGSSTDVEVPDDAEIIDVGGASILPGLINAHVHNGYVESNLRVWAQAGVTTVRDVGTLFRWTSASASIFEDRDRLNGNSLNARLVATGPIVTTVGGYGGYAVTSPEDARAKVNELIDAGADVIKIAIEDDLQGRRWPLLSPEEIAAIVETAHARGIRVAAHVSRSKHVQMAINAGVDDLNHMAVDTVSTDRLDATAAAGMVWVPTLELWNGVSPRYGLTWDRIAARNLLRFIESGGVVALGTDFDGFSTPFDLGMPITEIRLMADAGMTPMQVIVAATQSAATVCGLEDEIGTVEAGKIADVIIVDGNPLEDLNALESVRIVIHNGTIIRDER